MSGEGRRLPCTSVFVLGHARCALSSAWFGVATLPTPRPRRRTDTNLDIAYGTIQTASWSHKIEVLLELGVRIVIRVDEFELIVLEVRQQVGASFLLVGHRCMRTASLV